MKDIVIFGAGGCGKKACKHFGADRVAFFVDNSKEKVGLEIMGIPVISLSRYLSNHRDKDLYICVENNEPVVKQVIEQGLEKFKVFYMPLSRAYIHNVYAKEYVVSTSDRYNRLLDIYSPEKAEIYSKNGKWDICICGIPTHANYGTHMTYYSIYCYLKSLGYSVLVLNPPMTAEPKPCRIPMLFRDDEGYDRFDICEIYENEEQMQSVNDKADIFILGSDQMWNIGLMGKRRMSYLEFISREKVLLSYATSFGNGEWNEDKTTTNRLQDSLKRYKAISVREKSGVNICSQIFGVKANRCIDPVFLQPKEFYEKIIGTTNKPKGKLLVSYLFESEKYDESIRKVARDSCYKYSRLLPNELYVFEWLRGISESDFFVTNSYHGMCFALIFRKPFIVVEYKWSDRVHDLLSIVDLEERIIDSDGINNLKIEELDKIDYDAVWEILDWEIKSSKEWIKRNLR